MKTLLTLDFFGVVIAVFFGVIIVVSGGSYGPFLLFTILEFLVLAALATGFGKERKRVLKTYERSRGWKNVVANGIVPAALALLYFINATYNLTDPYFIIVAYIASVAAIAADKFSSEVGVFEREPRMLIGWGRVRAGVSGAVSPLGFLAGIVGSLLIGLGVLFYPAGPSGLPIPAVLSIIVVSGFLGDVVDSLLGYFEEKKIGNKYTTNTICALAGCLISLLLLSLF